MDIYKLLLLVFVLFFCVGFDFQHVTLKEAVKTGETVFVANVESSSVVDKRTGLIKANANLEIEKCFYGGSCKNREQICLTYVAQVSVGAYLPVSFPVGSQVLVVLNGDLRDGSYDFDSDINGGVDFVYTCNTFPYKITDKNSRFRCKDMMTDRVSEWLTFDSLEKIISMKEWGTDPNGASL